MENDDATMRARHGRHQVGERVWTVPSMRVEPHDHTAHGVAPPQREVRRFRTGENVNISTVIPMFVPTEQLVSFTDTETRSDEMNKEIKVILMDDTRRDGQMTEQEPHIQQDTTWSNATKQTACTQANAIVENGPLGAPIQWSQSPIHDAMTACSSSVQRNRLRDTIRGSVSRTNSSLGRDQ